MKNQPDAEVPYQYDRAIYPLIIFRLNLELKIQGELMKKLIVFLSASNSSSFCRDTARSFSQKGAI